MLKEKLQRAEENVLAATKEMELLKEKVKSTSKEADETITKHLKEIKLLNNKLISKSEEIEKLKLKAGKSQRSLSLSSSQKVKKSQVSQYQLTSQAGRKTRDERSDR